MSIDNAFKWLQKSAGRASGRQSARTTPRHANSGHNLQNRRHSQRNQRRCHCLYPIEDLPASMPGSRRGASGLVQKAVSRVGIRWKSLPPGADTLSARPCMNMLKCQRKRPRFVKQFHNFLHPRITPAQSAENQYRGVRTPLTGSKHATHASKARHLLIVSGVLTHREQADAFYFCKNNSQKQSRLSEG